MKKRKRNFISKEAREFISQAVEEEMNSGHPYKQSIAIAYSRARKEGYKVPAYRKRKIKNIS